MEKSVKIILYAILAMVVIMFLVSLFGDSSTKNIRKDLEEAKVSAGLALQEIQNSKKQLEEIKASMLQLSNTIDLLNDKVESTDTEKTIRDARDSKILIDLKEKIRVQKNEIESFKLPEIDVISTKKK